MSKQIVLGDKTATSVTFGGEHGCQEPHAVVDGVVQGCECFDAAAEAAGAGVALEVRDDAPAPSKKSSKKDAAA